MHGLLEAEFSSFLLCAQEGTDLASLGAQPSTAIVLLLIPRWASSAAANYSSTQVYQSCLCESGYCNSILPPRYRHFMEVRPGGKNLLCNHSDENINVLLCHNYMENPNAQLTPDGCFSLSHTWQLVLHSRKSQPGWSPLSTRRDKETYAPNQFRHEGIVQQLRDLIKLPLYFPHHIPKHCPSP